MKTLDKTSIFDGISQLLDADPSDIRPFSSRVLIRDAHDDEQPNGFLILKQPDDQRDRRRIGIVVSVGPGDNVREKWDKIARRKVFREIKGNLERLPMDVKPGDKVLYDRRRDEEFYIGPDRVRYSLVYEHQSILGVIEE